MNVTLDRKEILSILQGFNPWWADRKRQIPRFRRIAYHICLGHLKNLSLKRAILLSGPRRVGKTTILTQLAVHLIKDEDRPPTSIFYISLDHPLLNLASLPEILRIYHENIYEEGKPVVLLLDEVQYSKDWESHVKLLIDHRPEYRILATGSASVVQKQQLVESGVGRWVQTAIPTLSFYEFLHLRGEDTTSIPDNVRPSDVLKMDQREITQLGARFRKFMPLFGRYLLVGGFPETARQEDIALSQRLLREDVVERVLKRDLTSLFGVRNVNDLEKLFIYLCLNSGEIFAVKKIANALQSSPTTISNHLDLLEQANLIYRLDLAGLGGKKVLRQRQKIYLVDAALRNAVLLRGEEILTDSDQMGTIVETTVLRHLYAYYYPDSPRLCYWRDAKTDLEVDIIVQSPKYTLPVEVKYRENPRFNEKTGLAIYCSSETVQHAFWITKREEDFGCQELIDTTTKFLKIPAHVFTYLIGQAERLLWVK